MLEVLLVCKVGLDFSEVDVIDVLQVVGLVGKLGGIFELEDKLVVLFGGIVISVDVNVVEGEKSFFVYLNGIDVMYLVIVWLVNMVNKYVNMEEFLYVKIIDKCYILYVIVGDDYEGYFVVVKCQIIWQWVDFCYS